MLEVSMIVAAPYESVVSCLPDILPALKREGNMTFVELSRNRVAELAADPVNSAVLGQSFGRWYPAFAGNLQLRRLAPRQTELKIEGIVIPGMGPFPNKQWENSVTFVALQKLLFLAERHFGTTPQELVPA